MRGLFVSPTQFVAFAEPELGKRPEIATRARMGDVAGLVGLLPNPDPVLKKLGRDIAVYRDLLADAHIGGLVRRRKGAVLAMERGIQRESASVRNTKAVEAMLARLPMNRILSEILDATLFGYQPLEVQWGVVDGLLQPLALRGKPAEWFQFDGEGSLRFLSIDSGAQGEALPQRKFLCPRQDPSYANPYGVADLSRVFWPVAFKKGGLQFWVQFTERYGSPFLIGKQPRSAGPSETDALLDQLEAMVQDAVAVIPDDSSVQIVESAGKAASAEIFERLLLFCRSECSIALLGSNQAVEKDSTNASATAGNEVARDIRDADAALVAETLNQLVAWFVELNWGDAARPVYALWEQEEVDTVQAQRDKTLKDAGATFTPQYFQRAYSLQAGDLADADKPNEPASLTEPAAFAETNTEADTEPQTTLDAAINALAAGDPAREALASLFDTLREAITSAHDPIDALALLDAALPGLDTGTLETLLTQALFAAQGFGRLSLNAPAPAAPAFVATATPPKGA